MLEDQMRAALERRRQRSTLRSLTVLDTTARRTNLVATHDDRHPSSSSSSSSRGRGGPASSQGEAPPPRPLADFSSNDYLSLASSAEMREAFLGRVMSARENPLGSTGSRLLDGNSVEHEQLEHRLSTFFRSPSALFFSSGFEANVSIFSALPQAGDLIVYDELIHASVHDGMRTSRARFRVPFGHNDLGDLERVLRAFCREGAGDGKGVQLASGSTSTLSEEGDDDTHARISFAQALQRRQRNVFIAVESVYSMDGDLCPLANLVTLAERYVPRECLHIIVDEAHSTGLYGPSGRGLCVELGVEGVRVRLATFGKACGASGGVVLCDALTRTYLINYARPFIFSTAPPQTVLMAAHCSIDMLAREDVGGRRRERLVRWTRLLLGELRGIVEYANGREREMGVGERRIGADVGEGRRRPLLALIPALTDDPDRQPDEKNVTGSLPPSPIVPLLTPHPRPLCAHLQARGFLVRPITYPTVPLGQDRVRICVHAGNTEAEVRGLVRAVREWVDGFLEGERGKGKQKGVEVAESKGRMVRGVEVPASNLSGRARDGIFRASVPAKTKL